MANKVRVRLVWLNSIEQATIVANDIQFSISTGDAFLGLSRENMEEIDAAMKTGESAVEYMEKIEETVIGVIKKTKYSNKIYSGEYIMVVRQKIVQYPNSKTVLVRDLDDSKKIRDITRKEIDEIGDLVKGII